MEQEHLEPPYDPATDPLVVRCACCKEWTRKFRVTKEGRPGTRSWGGSGRCQRCYKPANPRGSHKPTPEQVQDQRALMEATGLGSFMERRRKRELQRNRKGHLHVVQAQQSPPSRFPPHGGGGDDAA